MINCLFATLCMRLRVCVHVSGAASDTCTELCVHLFSARNQWHSVCKYASFFVVVVVVVATVVDAPISRSTPTLRFFFALAGVLLQMSNETINVIKIK